MSFVPFCGLLHLRQPHERARVEPKLWRVSRNVDALWRDIFGNKRSRADEAFAAHGYLMAQRSIHTDEAIGFDFRCS